MRTIDGGGGGALYQLADRKKHGASAYISLAVVVYICWMLYSINSKLTDKYVADQCVLDPAQIDQYMREGDGI